MKHDFSDLRLDRVTRRFAGAGGHAFAALVVGAEQIFRPRAGDAVGRRQGVHQVQRRQVERIVRRDPRRKERRSKTDDQHHRRYDRDRRATKVVRQIARPPTGKATGGRDGGHASAVIPAKAGIHWLFEQTWIHAFAGMTPPLLIAATLRVLLLDGCVT